jgi:hypothetical protein
MEKNLDGLLADPAQGATRRAAGARGKVRATPNPLQTSRGAGDPIVPAGRIAA